MPNTHDGNDELHALMPVDTSNQRLIWDSVVTCKSSRSEVPGSFIGRVCVTSGLSL